MTLQRQLDRAKAREQAALEAYRSGYTPERHDELLKAGNEVLAIEQKIKRRAMTPAQRRAADEAARQFDRDMAAERLRLVFGRSRGRETAATIFGNYESGGMD